MKKIRILCRTAHTYGFHQNKIGFDLHNFRKDELKPEEKNYNPNHSKNNLFFRNGEELEHSQIEDLLELVEKDQKQKIKSVKGDMSDKFVGELNLSRSKTKSKIKKWADKSEEPEKGFFSNLLEKIGNEKINAEKEIEQLSSFGKVKRFNDKKKAILQLEKCNALFKVKENKSMSMKIISSEKVFKIPDKHNVEVKAEDWHKMIDEFHNRFYSDYDAYYTAIHLDEKQENPHAHHRLSGFNNKTKSFDLPDHELNLIRKLTKNPDLFQGKKWAKLDPNEVERFGQLYQSMMFQFCNKQLKKLGYEVEAIKRTPEEVLEDNHKYSNGKMRDRAFNGVEALKVEEKEIIESIQELKEEEKQAQQNIQGNKDLAKKWSSKAKSEKNKAINWNKKVKEQKGFFAKFKDETNQKIQNWLKNEFSPWFTGILKFKQSGLEKDLEPSTKAHLALEDEKVGAGKILEVEVEATLTADQNKIYKNQLNNARNNKNRKRP
jgi:hypothetical protein